MPLATHASLAILAGVLSPSFALASQPEGRPIPDRLTHVVNAYANFHPDGTRLVYQSDATGRWQLSTINVDGSNPRQLFVSPGNDITPVWSPDGTKIAFVSERDGNREVYVCNADGSNQVNLSNNPGHDIHPCWSADGSRIIFSSNRGKADRDDYDIYEMGADGTNVRAITTGPEIDTYASWSPDGTKIVTRRVINNKRNNEVFVMNADGSDPVNLTNSPLDYDGWPVWSPDGSRICFATGPTTGPAGGPGNKVIMLMNPDGSDRVQLTFPWYPSTDFCYDTQPSFSPDGRRIVFTRYRMLSNYESTELMLLDIS